MTERQAMQTEALSRAENGVSVANYPAIFEGFAEKGIDPADIHPRVNVLTYHAWRAKSRQVRKGEHGVRVVTWIPIRGTDEATGAEIIVGKRSKTAIVFHVTQTDPIV